MLKILVFGLILLSAPVQAQTVSELCYSIGEMAQAFNEGKEQGLSKEAAKVLAVGSLEGSRVEVLDMALFVVDVVYDSELPIEQIKDILVSKCFEAYN